VEAEAATEPRSGELGGGRAAGGLADGIVSIGESSSTSDRRDRPREHDRARARRVRNGRTHADYRAGKSPSASGAKGRREGVADFPALVLVPVQRWF